METDMQKMRKEWSKKETIGERFAVQRENAESVQVILYRPSNGMEEKKLPVLFNMHGGGWIAGDAVLMESFCQLLADQIPAFIVNINYQKADVHPFPYQTMEVVDTVKYFAAHAGEFGIDPERMAVGGHSAGAQLAASAALYLKEAGIELSAQMLVYPATDLTELKDGAMDELRSYVFADGGEDSPYMSPLIAKEEMLREIAPAIFVICGLDVLRKQGIAYAKRLIDAGVEVKVKEYTQALHGFLEVNRPDYMQGDERQDPQQDAFARECEKYLIRELRAQFEV